MHYMHGQIPLKKVIRAPKFQRLVHWCYYVLMHVILRKRKEYALQLIYLQDANKHCNKTWLSLKAKKMSHKRSCLKPKKL